MSAVVWSLKAFNPNEVNICDSCVIFPCSRSGEKIGVNGSWCTVYFGFFLVLFLAVSLVVYNSRVQLSTQQKFLLFSAGLVINSELMKPVLQLWADQKKKRKRFVCVHIVFLCGNGCSFFLLIFPSFALRVLSYSPEILGSWLDHLILATTTSAPAAGLWLAVGCSVGYRATIALFLLTVCSSCSWSWSYVPLVLERLFSSSTHITLNFTSSSFQVRSA